jgi:hypothetical protein
MNSLYFGTSSFLQQKCDGNQDVQEEMLNNTKKDNGLPLCESEETSLDIKSEKSMSIVAIPEGNRIVFPFLHVPFSQKNYIVHVLHLSSSLHNFFVQIMFATRLILTLLSLLKKSLVNLERNKLCSLMMLS